MKVLIASYHFTPFDVVASQRALAWAKYLPEAGVDTTVVTANHPGEKANTNAEVFYLDCPNLPSLEKPHWTNSIPGMSKVQTTIKHFKGELDPRAQQAASVFEEWLMNHLEHNQYDFYVGIFSPHFHIEHAHLLYQKFGLKYVIDFRDLFDNRLTMKEPDIGIKQTVIHEIILRKWKAWMADASGWITVGHSLAMKLQEWFGTSGECIINGVDLQEYQSFPALPLDKFTVLFTGRMYENQVLDQVFLAWQEFSKEKVDVNLLFIGPNEEVRRKIDAFEEKHGRIEGLEIKERVKREIAIGYQKSANILWMPGFSGNTGWPGTKIYEYIASQSTVLLSPSDNDVIEQMLAHQPNTMIAEESQDILAFLEEKYSNQQREGSIESRRDLTEIDRKTTAFQFVEYLISLGQS